ncbi:MAG: GntR family transcriptional regulator [Deltaproteobacteria bacterium]
MERELKVHREAAPIRTQTLEKLREAIADGYFQPGQRLFERELCEQLGVSRTSLREALRQLEAEGLVATIPHQGPIVARMTLKDAEEIYQVREVLECLASRLFALNADEAHAVELGDALKDLEQKSRENDVQGFLHVKKRFYEVLFSGSGNRVLHSFHRSLMARVNVLRQTSLSQAGRVHQSTEEISGLVHALLERDPDAAWHQCAEHLRKAAKAATEVLRTESSEQPMDKSTGGGE